MHNFRDVPSECFHAIRLDSYDRCQPIQMTDANRCEWCALYCISTIYRYNILCIQRDRERDKKNITMVDMHTQKTCPRCASNVTFKSLMFLK